MTTAAGFVHYYRCDCGRQRRADGLTAVDCQCGTTRIYRQDGGHVEYIRNYSIALTLLTAALCILILPGCMQQRPLQSPDEQRAFLTALDQRLEALRVATDRLDAKIRYLDETLHANDEPDEAPATQADPGLKLAPGDQYEWHSQTLEWGTQTGIMMDTTVARTGDSQPDGGGFLTTIY